MSKKKPVGVRSVYTFDQLSKEAKEKARDWFRDNNDMPMMWGHLMNIAKQELESAGFRVGEMGQEFNIWYSLGHCRGDGVSFEGDIERGGKRYRIIKTSHQYEHEYTMNVELVDNENQDADDDATEVLDEMRTIAKEVERQGYEAIEYENSEEYIDECMDLNGYTFTGDGERLEPDA